MKSLAISINKSFPVVICQGRRHATSVSFGGLNASPKGFEALFTDCKSKYQSHGVFRNVIAHLALALVVAVISSILCLPCRAQAVTWTETDLGSTGAAGSFTYASGTPPTFTVEGAGTGFGSPDAMAFVSTPACGCFEIEARVSSQQNTGNGAIAGLCVRDCLQPYGGKAVIAVTPGNGVNFYYAQHAYGVNTVNGPSGQTAPVYLRLTRTGTATGGYTDTGFNSTDGINWTSVGSWTENNTNPLPNKLYVGFVVSSSVSGTLNTTVFDHVSYMTSVPQQSTGGLLLWLRSDCGVTYSGSSVSEWADQSGNSLNATQSSGGLQPTFSTGAVNSGVLPTINFNGSQYLSLPSGFANLSSGLDCFIVMNRATSSGTDVAFTCGNASNSDAVIAETTGTNAALYCYNSATSSNVTTSSGPISSGTYQLLEETFQPGSSAGIGTVYVNDTQEAQATNLVSTLSNTTRSDNYVGTGIGITNSFDGSIAEILVYSGITPAQRAMVQSYLLSKFGLGSAPTLDAPIFSPGPGVFLPQQKVSLSQDQNATVFYTVDGSTPSTSSLWFYTNESFFLQNVGPAFLIRVPSTQTIKAIAVAPFFNNSSVASAAFQVDPTTSAIPRSNLVMWLRADNSVTTSGSDVTSWGDVSGSENSATNGSNQPTLVTGAINGLPAVSFASGSSQFLQVPAGMASFTSGASIFLVTKPAAVTAGARFLDFGNGSASDNIFLDEPTNTGASLFTYNGATSSSVTSSSAITLGQYQLLEAIYNGSSTGTIYTNAVEGVQSTSLQTLQNLTRNNNYIGQASQGGNYFDGQIAEILVYNTAVTASQQAAIEGYLFNKYNLINSASTPAPTISVAGGTLSAPTQVAIEATTGSTIYITLDGSTPTTSSPVYSGPINVDYSLTLKAIAVLNGVESSVSSATYTLNSTQWPAPSSTDTTSLQIQLQLPSVAIPQDSNQH
jgi:hypothetical protein